MWGDFINFIELNEKMVFFIQNIYWIFEILGKDRIVVVVGVILVGLVINKLIVDIGICIIFELLKDNEVYLGGNIFFGVKM